MKIVFMGTPDFAVPALKALAESAKHEVSLVVTQPDRPRGRSGKPAPSDVKLCAEQYGIPVFQPEKVREEAAVERLRRENADIFVVAAFGQLLPRTILEMPRFGCINIHGSLLPAYRGAAPVQWAVLDGQKEAGDTIMQMNEGLDTGDILMQESIPLSADETAGSLYDKLSSMGGPLLLKALDAIEAGTVTPVPQGDSGTHYAKMLRKEMGNIDWTKSAEEIGRLVRGLNPWPSAYTHWNGKMLKIWMAETVTQEELSALGCDEKNGMDLKEAQPGTVMIVTKDTLMVQTGDGLLALTELQMEGKKRMPVQAFLMGCRLQTGEKLERIGRY
ncbi:MAG: methionyl-tRNA formyltransferase [Bacillota bacterium]|nr:methionyl-tRNA formyltransferase [Bacillota bacterium]